MTESDPENSSDFPRVGTWGEDEKDEVDCTERSSRHLSNWGKSLSAELFEKESKVCYFKSYNERRLSDPLPSVYNITESTLGASIRGQKISKILNLLFMQMLTTPASRRNLPYIADLRKIQERYFLKVLKVLLNVLSGTMNTPAESQTLEYCEKVLLEVTADLETTTVINYFLQAVQADHRLFKHSSIALLSSYCTKRKISLTMVPHLLHRLIFFYIDKDQSILKFLWQAVNAIIESLNFSDQMKMLPDVCLAVKFAVCCVQDKKVLPGLCHSEGIASILSMYEQAILKGTMKDKRQAAKALQQLIVFSSEDALKPYLCKITSVLIHTIMIYKDDTSYWRTKEVIVETLAHLLAKVGIFLRPLFSQLQIILLKPIKSCNRSLYLKCVTALSYLALCCDKLDELYEYIFEAIKNYPNATKERMLHLLRYVIQYACVGMPENSRFKFTVIVDGMVQYFNESVRIAAAACLGTMCGCFFRDDELEKIVKKNFVDDDGTLLYSMRHGRSIALMVALKEAPEKILQEQFAEKVTEVLLSYITSENLEILFNGIRGCGYYILYKLKNGEEIYPVLLNTFCDTMNHSSEDVNQMFVVAVNFVARKISLPLYVVEAVVHELLNGMKKGSSRLKSSCELALVAVFDLFEDDETVEIYMKSLDPDSQKSFKSCILIYSKNTALQPELEDDLDFTHIKQIPLMS